MTIFHYGGIDDSHLLHKKELFTYGTLKSANLRHQGNIGSIGVQWTERFTTEGKNYSS